MRWRDRRAVKRMTDPQQGAFVVVDWYFPHPGRTPMQTMFTGYLTGPGIERVPAEVLKKRGKVESMKELPATIDRADPSRFVVDWSRVPDFDGGASEARAAAQRAAGGA